MKIIFLFIVLSGVMVPVLGGGFKKEDKGNQFSKHFEKNAIENLVILSLISETKTFFIFRKFSFGKPKVLAICAKISRIYNAGSLHSKPTLV